MEHHHLHKEPTSVFAGDTISWRRNLSDYQPGDGWTLTYALRGPASLDITAAADPDFPGFLVTAVISVVAGDYYLQGSVTKGTEVHTIYNGNLTVLPSIAAISGIYDGRSLVKKTLDAIDAVIAGRATRSDLNYEISTGTTVRRLQSIPHEQLLKFRGVYAQKYWQEQNPGKLGPSIRVHFRDGY